MIAVIGGTKKNNTDTLVASTFLIMINIKLTASHELQTKR